MLRTHCASKVKSQLVKHPLLTSPLGGFWSRPVSFMPSSNPIGINSPQKVDRTFVVTGSNGSILLQEARKSSPPEPRLIQEAIVSMGLVSILFRGNHRFNPHTQLTISLPSRPHRKPYRPESPRSQFAIAIHRLRRDRGPDPELKKRVGLLSRIHDRVDFCTRTAPARTNIFFGFSMTPFGSKTMLTSADDRRIDRRIFIIGFG